MLDDVVFIVILSIALCLGTFGVCTRFFSTLMSLVLRIIGTGIVGILIVRQLDSDTLLRLHDSIDSVSVFTRPFIRASVQWGASTVRHLRDAFFEI
jgi:uncharacterized membrane protein